MLNNYKRFNLLIFSVFIFCSLNLKAWTKLYSAEGKDLAVSVDSSKKSKKFYKVEWSERAICEFKQLVFSWNALRPGTGYYVFWVQVRDKATKKWYSGHKAVLWGKDSKGKLLQKSFFSSGKNKKDTVYNHVRLELPENKTADAFRISVEIHGDFNASNINCLIVNTSNYKEFTTEIGLKYFNSLKTVKINSIPQYSQMVLNHPKSDSLCSPASLSMVMGYYLKKEIDPVEVANSVYDAGLDIYGSWLFNVARGHELSNGKLRFYVERLNSFKSLYEYLERSIPVIVSIRGPLEGGATPYANGHLLVVSGFDGDNKKVICHDPAFSSNDTVLVSYPIDNFIKAWERSFRLAYVALS